MLQKKPSEGRLRDGFKKRRNQVEEALLGAYGKNPGEQCAEAWGRGMNEKNSKIEMTAWVCGRRKKEISGLVTEERQ